MTKASEILTKEEIARIKLIVKLFKAQRNCIDDVEWSVPNG